jgi:hypothetical protein
MTKEIFAIGLLSAVLLLLVGLIVRAIIRKLQDKTRWPGKIFYLVICLGLMAYFISIPLAIFTRDVAESRAARCTANLHTLSVALDIYVFDRDGALPPADAWCDRLKPSIVSDRIFVCPEASRLRCGYAFNEKLGERKIGDLKSPEKTVLLFESDNGWNAHGGIELLPKRPRHLHRARDIYVYVTGDTVMLSREKAKDLIWTPTWGPKEKP